MEEGIVAEKTGLSGRVDGPKMTLRNAVQIMMCCM